jgi:hypothetical protein
MLSKRVMALILSPARVRTMSPLACSTRACGALIPVQKVHRRPSTASGWSRLDIRLWWRRTGAAERTGAAISEALGLVAGRPGRSRSGPSSACRQAPAEKAESTSHKTNTSHTSAETSQHTCIPRARRSEPSLRTTRKPTPTASAWVRLPVSLCVGEGPQCHQSLYLRADDHVRNVPGDDQNVRSCP